MQTIGFYRFAVPTLILAPFEEAVARSKYSNKAEAGTSVSAVLLAYQIYSTPRYEE